MTPDERKALVEEMLTASGAPDPTNSACRSAMSAALAVAEKHFAAEISQVNERAAIVEQASEDQADQFHRIAKDADAQIERFRKIISALNDDALPPVKIREGLKDGGAVLVQGHFATPAALLDANREITRLREALKAAEKFTADELNARYSSPLRSHHKSYIEYMEVARSTLAAIKSALGTEGEGT